MNVFIASFILTLLLGSMVIIAHDFFKNLSTSKEDSNDNINSSKNEQTQQGGSE